MRHAVDGRKFGRNTSHRKAMFKNMANSIITHEQVVTTLEKAKEIRRHVDRLVTLAKSGTPASRRLAFDRTRDELVVKKLFSDLAVRYKARAGGYTRVLKLSDRRWGDAAEMAVVQLVDAVIIDKKKKAKTVNADGTTAAAPQAAADPFARFRKMFGKQVKKGEAGGDQAPKKEKKAKAAKPEKVAKVAKAKTEKVAKKSTKKDA